jgi:hypothetical protein
MSASLTEKSAARVIKFEKMEVRVSELQKLKSAAVV